ncbi:tRNA (adenosine(37)-N6)-threonylcarbamoyltransferase complex dimerization subunit type 1 TsaB [Paeniglutamicibacter sp. Y32M11]|uniref:tRNA (adenosine(37)-N6)-threonylcarbamoyltransferase complex dimerization subunit type 1 TsaB n=1 Tax=Paeniglutamicibacter sp. Y32M11 TaxID=2853258 RepID=UPI001C531E9B|nr:tRNA (adenosine(37)-N6)-threonylcarbamoyltransferase complex dimerization subunit type 1 TsaB [Paeniglutamicibacter sp. Y32M11]QXQ09238.1 tRNA (adenosine(37)-N6)-threonylcarbamoyltransferase complex dimerization subunit type 1 TsaB [Paeniglutamicibacter sp. Y32M11]
MLLLAIDTSANASAALLETTGDDVAVLGSFTSLVGNDHAEVLAPAIEALLRDAGAVLPDAVVVGVGPGPFTGLRVGLASAKTLAFVWDVALHGVMSLDAIALEAVATEPTGDFTVAIDARRKELYWARYHHDGLLADGPHVSIAEELPPLPTFGAGAGLYAERLTAIGATVVPGFDQAHPSAESLGTSAARSLAAGRELLSTEPLYLRESDAKVPAVMKGKLL